MLLNVQKCKRVKDPSWRSDTKLIQQHLCYNQQPFKSTCQEHAKVSACLLLCGCKVGVQIRQHPSLFKRTSSKWIAMISTIFAGIFVMLIVSILNSSVLLSLFFKDTWNFFTIGVSFVTDIVTPIPRLCLIYPLMLSIL